MTKLLYILFDHNNNFVMKCGPHQEGKNNDMTWYIDNYAPNGFVVKISEGEYNEKYKNQNDAVQKQFLERAYEKTRYQEACLYASSQF